VTLVALSDEIVRAAQRGDERAFATIVDAYQLPVFNFVLRLVGDRELAEDLTQDVFARAYASLPRFSFRSKLSTWLFRIAKNRVIDEARAQSSRPQVEELTELELHAFDPPAERHETMAALWRAVAGLQLEYKEALLLRDVVGLSYAEIAEATKTSLANVKWRIYRARSDVAAALERAGFGSDSETAPQQAA
jgi:RNA polymerase sigma-70 factor, ECF subfamily